jgi:hypothetical protein
MSKRNKVNPGQYTQAGRLSADDAAREHVKQGQAASNTTAPSEPHRPQRQSQPAATSSSENASDDTAEETSRESKDK